MDTCQLLIGDLILIRGDKYKFVDDAILLGELIERGEGVYVHVAVYIGDGKIVEAQSGELSGIYPLSKYSEYDVGEMYVDEEFDERIIEAANHYAHRRYGWFGIFASIVEMLTTIVLPYKGKTLMCTELANKVFKRACGYSLSCKRYPTPDDVAFESGASIRKGGS